MSYCSACFVLWKSSNDILSVQFITLERSCCCAGQDDLDPGTEEETGEGPAVGVGVGTGGDDGPARRALEEAGGQEARRIPAGAPGLTRDREVAPGKTYLLIESVLH